MPFVFLPVEVFLPALIGTSLAGIACGLAGAFVVRMDLASVGFTMSHAAFAGAAVGLIAPIDPIIGALLFSIGVAAVVGPLAEKTDLSANTIMGINFPLMMALGLIMLKFSPQTAMSSSALSLLWGSVLSLAVPDVVQLAVLTGIMVLLTGLFAKELEAVTFDRQLSEASGIPYKPFYYGILFLTGITVALSLKIIGGLLVFALLVNPASTAYQFFYDMRKIIIFSPIFGLVFSLIGLVLSLITNFPVGSSIALSSVAGFGVASLVSPKR